MNGSAAEVVSAGMTYSFLKAARLTRTRHAHQITLLARHSLQSDAFEIAGDTGAQSVEDWRKGVWRKVSSSTKMPVNWKNFLSDQLNKKELFAF